MSLKFLWKQGERLRGLINRSIAENRLEGFFETDRASLQSGLRNSRSDASPRKPSALCSCRN